MSLYQTRPEPGASLAERLERLHGQIGTLAGRLKEGIAGAVGAAVAEALRDLLRGLLGAPRDVDRRGHHGPPDDTARHGRHARDPWADGPDGPDPWDGRARGDPFNLLGGDWDEDDLDDPDGPAQAEESRAGPGRWQAAGDAAVRAGAWWLGRQTGRRPGLTTLLVAGATGVLAWLAGPAAAPALGVLAAVAGSVATADTARSLAAGLRALVGR